MSYTISDYTQETEDLFTAFEIKFQELECVFLELQKRVAQENKDNIRDLALNLGEMQDPLLFLYYYTYPDALRKSDIELMEKKVREYTEAGIPYSVLYGPLEEDLVD